MDKGYTNDQSAFQPKYHCQFCSQPIEREAMSWLYGSPAHLACLTAERIEAYIASQQKPPQGQIQLDTALSLGVDVPTEK